MPAVRQGGGRETNSRGYFHPGGEFLTRYSNSQHIFGCIETGINLEKLKIIQNTQKMDQEYRIALHSKSVTGFDTYGEFYIGNNKTEATRLFSKLKGSCDHLEEGILYMELRTIFRGLPVDLQMIQCSLDEVAENTKIITRHLFAGFSLDD